MNVTLPLSNKDLLHHLATKDTDPVLFHIDYRNSSIKSNGFLSFIVNADLNFHLSNIDDDIIIHFLHMNNIFSKPNQLTLIHANMIMYLLTDGAGCFAYDPSHYDFTALLRDDNVIQLLVEHMELLSSIPAFIINNLLQEARTKEPVTEEEDDDKGGGEPFNFNTIGKSWVNLLQLPMFLDIFLSEYMPKTNKTQIPPTNFNDYIFKGKNLTAFICRDSYYFVTSSLFAHEYITSSK